MSSRVDRGLLASILLVMQEQRLVEMTRVAEASWFRQSSSCSPGIGSCATRTG